MSLWSLLINLMHTCWIKALIYFKRKKKYLSDLKLLKVSDSKRDFANTLKKYIWKHACFSRNTIRYFRHISRLVARLISRWVCRGRWYAWLDDKTANPFKGNVKIDLVFIQALFSRNFQHGQRTGRLSGSGIPQTSGEIFPERRLGDQHKTPGRLFIPSQ